MTTRMVERRTGRYMFVNATLVQVSIRLQLLVTARLYHVMPSQELVRGLQ